MWSGIKCYYILSDSLFIYILNYLCLIMNNEK